jgi:hypothetical protein
MVQTFGVFSEHRHVDQARFPNLGESPMHFVRDAFVEFDWAEVGVEVQAASHSKDHRSTSQITVGQKSPGVANGAEVNCIGFIAAEFKGAFGPFFTGFEVMLPTALNDGLFKTMVCVGFNSVENTLSLKRNFATSAVSGKNSNPIISHAFRQGQPLHERDPLGFMVSLLEKKGLALYLAKRRGWRPVEVLHRASMNAVIRLQNGNHGPLSEKGFIGCHGGE